MQPFERTKNIVPGKGWKEKLTYRLTFYKQKTPDLHQGFSEFMIYEKRTMSVRGCLQFQPLYYHSIF